MDRTQIYLDRRQAEALDREARRRGQTRSHLIREAIDRQYGLTTDRAAVARALRDSAGAWRGRREDGEAYVERLRQGRRWRELEAEADSDDLPA